MQPQEATKLLLKKLSSRRMRDVVERRFGLKGGKRHTLDAIGKGYKITRERVRQIESDAIRHLAESSASADIQPTFRALEAHILNHGSVMAEPHLFATVADARSYPHVRLLMNIGHQFHLVDENDEYRERWALHQTDVERGEKIMAGVVRDLKERNTPVSEKELHEMISRNMRETAADQPAEEPVLSALRETHKSIRKNPYGEYGLTSWAAVSPRGVRDKAHVVLAKSGKPMHFQDVARAITTVGWSKRKASISSRSPIPSRPERRSGGCCLRAPTTGPRSSSIPPSRWGGCSGKCEGSRFPPGPRSSTAKAGPSSS
jgi:hypothetical protein